MLPHTFHSMPGLPTLIEQELPYNDPESTFMFPTNGGKELYMTERCMRVYAYDVILACWQVLTDKAEQHGGLESLQVFESEEDVQELWFLEEPFTIVAMLQSDY